EFGKRAAMNAPIQGSAADLIKLAMLEVEKAIEATSAKLILQVHDELVFEVKEDEAEKVAQMVVDAMSQVVQLDVPLEVSYAIGKNWYEAK
ncbi:MAG TPA: DNA polymerase I, partial [Erysipelotrichaceae bacterium]|nr:DNA polymerase I [Erysipelotrichaceae bacterium]